MPAAKRAGSTSGAPSTCTDAGPPDKMMAEGRFASIFSTEKVCGTISE